MEKIKLFFKNLGVSGILGVSTSIIMILSAGLYAMFYAGNAGLMDNMSWESFIAFMVGGVISLGLCFFKKGMFAPIVQMTGSLFGLAYYVMKIFKYVSAAFTGIDSTWEPQFFILTIFILASVILSCVNLFKLVPDNAIEAFNNKEDDTNE